MKDDVIAVRQREVVKILRKYCKKSYILRKKERKSEDLREERLKKKALDGLIQVYAFRREKRQLQQKSTRFRFENLMKKLVLSIKLQAGQSYLRKSFMRKESIIRPQLMKTNDIRELRRKEREDILKDLKELIDLREERRVI